MRTSSRNETSSALKLRSIVAPPRARLCRRGADSSAKAAGGSTGRNATLQNARTRRALVSDLLRNERVEHRRSRVTQIRRGLAQKPTFSSAACKRTAKYREGG